MGKYVKGLFKDTAHIDQPEGSWRYARNVVVHPVDGAISNENGMDAVRPAEKPLPDGQWNIDTLPDGAIVIGTIEITDDKIILFLAFNTLHVDDAFIASGYNSEIGLFESELYTTLYRPPVNNINTTRDRMGAAGVVTSGIVFGGIKTPLLF